MIDLSKKHYSLEEKGDLIKNLKIDGHIRLLYFHYNNEITRLTERIKNEYQEIKKDIDKNGYSYLEDIKNHTKYIESLEKDVYMYRNLLNIVTALIEKYYLNNDDLTIKDSEYTNEYLKGLLK